MASLLGTNAVMRMARIKVDAQQSAAVYHCISRTVNGERLFDSVAKEVLRKQLWQVAEYCGLEILTFAILDNHFHVLVRVPVHSPVADQLLLQRFARLYPRPTRYQTARLEVVRAQLSADGPEAVAWRRRQLALMGDVSAFMKLVKQRFSIWFNRTHQRFGTLWSERFKSVLVEPRGHALLTVAAYIDLNPVRAGLVVDPKDYRFCGYSDALAGVSTARAGLARVAGVAEASVALELYRQTLFGVGSAPRESAAHLGSAAAARVQASAGRLPLATVLRHRIRHFSDGVVLGSKAFVALHAPRQSRRAVTPCELPFVTDWGGDLATLRARRRPTFQQGSAKSASLPDMVE